MRIIKLYDEYCSFAIHPYVAGFAAYYLNSSIY